MSMAKIKTVPVSVRQGMLNTTWQQLNRRRKALVPKNIIINNNGINFIFTLLAAMRLTPIVRKNK